MEKAAGVPLFQRWGEMTEYVKLQLIKNLTKLETQLAAIRFPAYGGLYLRSDTSRSTRPLDHEIDPTQSFEIDLLVTEHLILILLNMTEVLVCCLHYTI